MANLRSNLLALLALALIGCVGTDVDGSQSSLGDVEIRAVDTAPVPVDLWQAAPAGCQGRLDSTLTFRFTSGADGLVAAVSPDGRVVCVDTLDSVRVEIESTEGTPEETPAIDPTTHSMDVSGVTEEPTPQPNSRPRSPTQSDPTPQPNMESQRQTP